MTEGGEMELETDEGEAMHNRRSDKWTIDKRIPVSLLFAIFVQSVGAAVWATSLSSRVEALEKNTATATQYAVLGERIGTMKDDIGSVKNDIGSLKDDVRRMAIRGK